MNVRNGKLSAILILILVYASGMVMFQTYYKISLLLILAWFVVLLLFVKPKKNLTMKQLLYSLGISNLVLITMVINSDYSHVETHLGIIVKVIISLLTCLYVGFEDFIRIYPKVMSFIIVTSFPFFLIGIFASDFLLKLPLLFKTDSAIYANAFFHVFPMPIWAPTLIRNNGPFWEPGAFQAFISLALILEIMSPSRSVKRIVIFIIGLISTGSTTGYFILLLISFLALINYRINVLVKYLSLSLVILFICTPMFNDFVIGKFSKESDRYESYARRDADWKSDFEVTYDNNIILGAGYAKYFEQFPVAMKDNLNVNGRSSSNSMTLTIAVYGLLLFMLILTMIYRFSGVMAAKMKGSVLLNRIVILLILFLMYNSEPFYLAPVWILLGYYGISESKVPVALIDRKRKQIENVTKNMLVETC